MSAKESTPLSGGHLGTNGTEGNGHVLLAHPCHPANADDQCRDLPGVKDVRVRGAIGVVEFQKLDDLNGLRRRCIDAGIWIRPFGNIVYLTPALNIGADDLSRLLSSIVTLVKEQTT